MLGHVIINWVGIGHLWLWVFIIKEVIISLIQWVLTTVLSIINVRIGIWFCKGDALNGISRLSFYILDCLDAVWFLYTMIILSVRVCILSVAEWILVGKCRTTGRITNTIELAIMTKTKSLPNFSKTMLILDGLIIMIHAHIIISIDFMMRIFVSIDISYILSYYVIIVNCVRVRSIDVIRIGIWSVLLVFRLDSYMGVLLIFCLI